MKQKKIKWHETCKCECRLDAIVCYQKQRWNKHKCRCECKELIDKSVCDKEFLWNPGNCECECNKSCYFSGYLDYKNCKCRKKSVDKLVDEYTKTIEETSLVKTNSTKYKHNSCILYILLFSIFFIINFGIDTYFFYFKYMNRNKKMFLNIMNMFIKQQFN